MAKTEKIAVVLFNLGGPDSREAIMPFLFNFFMDKNIIRLPLPFRFFLAKLISARRGKKEASASYGALGDKSPLLENTKKQADTLQKELGAYKTQKFKIFICMRYWHPMAPQVAQDVRRWGADKVFLLPLYPQFSTTTTRSSLEKWKKAQSLAAPEVPASLICCYPFNEGFIKASAENIAAEYKKARKDGHKAPRILFSAHGLPESVIKDGDPYQWQCEQSAEKIARQLKKSLKIKALDWQICYQSRVGPMKWIGPSMEQALERAAKDGKAVVIYPHAFTQEHVETLVELDAEYRDLAKKMGINGYYRARTVGTHPDFIKGLAALVTGHADNPGIHAEGMKALCPEKFSRCCMKTGNFEKG